MKKFLTAHYEKIILAGLLVIFAALLYYQLLFVQKAQTQDVAAKVNPVQKPSDYTPVDFASDRKYRMETVFSEWNKIESAKDSPIATQMMSPYPMAECVYCHTLIPADAYPAINETKNGKCPACGKALAPREQVEDELLGKADSNSNGIPDEWEKENNISADFESSESDEDGDGFTLFQEYKAKTNPTDPKSHPQYISQIYVSAISQTRFRGLELVSVDTTKKDKKDWVATFNVIRNNRTRSEFVQINVGTFKSNEVDFKLIDIEIDDSQKPVAYVQRIDKVNERIPCRIKQAVYDPYPRVRFLNMLNNSTFINAVGTQFKLGSEKTGEELYEVVSADVAKKEVVVKGVPTDPEADASTLETFKLVAAPKDNTASDTGKSSSKASSSSSAADDSPFLKQQ